MLVLFNRSHPCPNVHVSQHLSLMLLRLVDIFHIGDSPLPASVENPELVGNLPTLSRLRARVIERYVPQSLLKSAAWLYAKGARAFLLASRIKAVVPIPAFITFTISSSVKLSFRILIASSGSVMVSGKKPFPSIM